VKYLGVDYGTKRIGLAVSDDDGSMAFPYLVLDNRGVIHAADDIIMACSNKDAGAVVIGQSIDYALQDNPIMKHIYKLEEYIKEKSKLEIYYEDERLSSLEAERIQGKNEKLDASAATIILNSFLEKRKNSPEVRP